MQQVGEASTPAGVQMILRIQGDLAIQNTAICVVTGGGGAPRNTRFVRFPHTDSGMMQIQTLVNDMDTGYARDYAQSRLLHTLTAGHTYEVIFYAVACQATRFFHNHLGAFFDDGTIDTTRHYGYLQPRTPQIDDTSIIDTTQWRQIKGRFTANGSESYITIANFYSRYAVNTSPDITPYLAPGSLTFPSFAWYLIDDVSVIDCGNIPDAGGNQNVVQGDSIHLGPNETLLPYTWYQQGIPTAIDSGGGLVVRPTVTTTYILEQDLCGVKRYDTVTVHVTPAATPLLQWRGVGTRLYPNPASEVLYIDNARGAEITIMDVTGRLVLQLSATEDKQPVDVGTLMPGVYGVQLLDGVTGERVTGRFVRSEP